MRKILILEQDLKNAQKLMLILNSLGGFQVILEKLCNGLPCQMSQYDGPDVVFIKVGSMDADGFSIGRSIRQKKPSIHIVYLSETEDYAVEAFDEAAEDYLVYPLTVDRVAKTMNRIN